MKLVPSSVLLLLLVAVSAQAQEAEVEPSDETASESTEAPPGGSEIGSADSNIFETVSGRIQKELEAGNLDPNLGESDGSESGQIEETTAGGETVLTETADQPTTPEEQQERDEQADQVDHPFGDPAQYPVDPDAEPLPQKGDPPIDSDGE